MTSPALGLIERQRCEAWIVWQATQRAWAGYERARREWIPSLPERRDAVEYALAGRIVMRFPKSSVLE